MNWRRRRTYRKQRRRFVVEQLEDRRMLAGVITQVDYFDTWDGVIPSTDAAGVTYHPPSDSLFIADSEINEINALFDGNNIFQSSRDGTLLLQEFTSGNTEPTGITFNEFDGFFYVTNDNSRLITRYDSALNNPLATVDTRVAVPSATDPEGITSDLSGMLYVADGKNGGRQVLVYDSTLAFQYSFSVSDRIPDPEGIAYHPDTNHLFIVSSSGSGDTVFEYALNGVFVEEYDLGGLTPATISPQGATFAPTSDTNDPPFMLALYIADGGVDNSPDGGVYETLVSGAQLAQNTAPLVAAGADQTIKVPFFPAVVSLNAAMADDGLPDPPAAVTTTWSQVSGPGTVIFANGSAVDTMVTLPTSGTYVLRLTADDDEFVVSDDVTIDVSAGVQLRVAASSDDAEEHSSGNMQLTSTDLDLAIKDVVGVRFSGVDIPLGSVITNAFIQFHADESDSVVTLLTIEGEDIDDAPTFTSSSNNISTRDRTASSVVWPTPTWTQGDAGPDQRTPNIAAVIQDIVDLPGWSAGNALAFIITGTGKRAAESYDADPALAPELTVEFTPPGFTITETLGTTEVSETGTQDTFDVVLDVEPASDVVLLVTSADTGEVTVDQSSLTFTPANWNVAQTVTVTGVDDAVADGDQITLVTLAIDDANSDDAYDPVADQSVSVTTAGGLDADFNDDDNVDGKDFLIWQRGFGTGSTLSEGDANGDTVVNNEDLAIWVEQYGTTDDETPGFTITETAGTTEVSETGTQDTFDVVLDVEPASDVVLLVTGADTGEVTVDQSSLTFTPANWNVAQTVTVTGVDGAVADGDQITPVTLSIDDSNSDDAFDPLADQVVSVTTTDDETMSPTVKLETGFASGITNADWTARNLNQSYSSMVVVVSVNYDGTSVPLVPRIQNAAGSSFELRVDRTDGLTDIVPGIDVHYLVVEEGVYTQAEHGVTMEAVKFNSTVDAERFEDPREDVVDQIAMDLIETLLDDDESLAMLLF